MTISITKIKLKISNAEVDIECDIHNLDENAKNHNILLIKLRI